MEMDTQTISSTHTHTEQTAGFYGFTAFKTHTPVQSYYLSLDIPNYEVCIYLHYPIKLWLTETQLVRC